MSRDGWARDSTRQNGSMPPRRTSLLGRITDKITSFLPSLFESREEVEPNPSSPLRTRPIDVSCPPETHVHPRLPTHRSRLSHRLSITRIDRVEIPEHVAPTCNNSDVDLDACEDRSNCSSESKASVSTSGVSSLFPRNRRNMTPSLQARSFPSRPLSEYRKGSLARTDESSQKRTNSFAPELWSDVQNTEPVLPGDEQPARKRMRIDTSQSGLSTAFSSPFYRGKISYGGASSLRGLGKAQNVFEHVAPLRFMIEAPEKATPSKVIPRTPNPVLSATAKRILDNLERNSFPIASSDKIPLPAYSSLPMRSTTRYPPYMAAYKRYKASRQQPQQVLALADRPPNGKPQSDQSNELGMRDNEKSSVLGSPWSLSTAPTVILPANAIISKFNFSRSETTKSPPSGEPVPVQLSIREATTKPNPVSLPNLIVSPIRRTQSTFEFSNPIVLNLPKIPVIKHIEVAPTPQYTFSVPRPYRKSSGSVSTSSAELATTDFMENPEPTSKAVVHQSLLRCESCLTEISSLDTTCKSCHLPRSSLLTTKALINTSQGVWDCPTCMVKNKANASSCVCCQTANPGEQSSSGRNCTEKSIQWSVPKIASDPTFNFGPPKASTNSSCGSGSTKAERSTLGLTFGSSTSSVAFPTGFASSTHVSSEKKWDCPTCLVKNDASVGACLCCQTKKPGSVVSTTEFQLAGVSNPIAGSIQFGGSSAAVSSVLHSGFKFPNAGNAPDTSSATVKFGSVVFQTPGASDSLIFNSAEWTCPTCLVKNNDSVMKCLCCQTPKPVEPSAIAADSNWDSNATKVVSVGECPAFPPKKTTSNEASTDKWSCPTCLVQNSASFDACPCCQTKKPGGSTLKAPSTLFQHIDSPPVIISTSKPSFHFGAPNLNSLPSTFSFGTPVAKPIGALTTLSSLTSDTTVSTNFAKPEGKPDVVSSSAPSVPPVKSIEDLTNGRGGAGFQFLTTVTPAVTFTFGATKENVTPATIPNPSLSLASTGFGFQPAQQTTATALAPVTGTTASNASQFDFKFGANSAGTVGGNGLFNFSGSAPSMAGAPPSLFSATRPVKVSRMRFSTPTERTGVRGRLIRRAVRRQHHG